MNNANLLKNSVVLFVPEAGIYPYIRGLAVLGDAIKKQGGEVFITHDTGQMLRSPIVAMKRLSAKMSEKEKTKINKVNNKIFKNAQKKYKFAAIELSDLVDNKLMAEINDLDKVPDNSLENINFKGFPVGKIAQYDFMLETKSSYSSKVSEEQKVLYLAYIKNTALAVAMTDNICKRYKPSLFLTFNEYAQGQAVRYGAEINNVSRMALTYPVHFNINTSRFLIWKPTYSSFFYSHCQKWNSMQDVPINSQLVKECWNDNVFRLFGVGGSHIFSTKKGGDPMIIFNRLKLNPNKKVIVVYTSSHDERLGADTIKKVWGEGPFNTNAFSNQIEWLSVLHDYVAKREDIQIVVRVHPREGARQFGFDSEHLKQLKKEFSENTPNFIMIWPDDPISSYDLMELANICLAAWSSVGHEAARLGIPVLSYAGNLTYPNADFIQVATTPEEYKRKLDSIINFEFNWKHLVKAVRFYHWRTFIPSLDLSETVPSDFDDNSVWPEAPSSKVSIINDILSGKQNLIEYNIKQWQDSLPANAEFKENEAMRQGIRYFIDKIFYPPATHGKSIDRLLYIIGKVWRKYLRRYWYKFIIRKNPLIKKSSYAFTDYTLEFTTKISQLEKLRQKTKKDKKLRIIIADGLYAILIHKGKTLRRMSPMVVRLAKLYNDSLNNK